MPLPNVLTIEEISQQLRVPEAAIEEEIAEGRLRTITVAGYTRVLEPDFDAFLSALQQDSRPSSPDGGAATKHPPSPLSPAPDFTHTWPAKKGMPKTTEQFTTAYEGRVTYRGQNYHVKLGFTHRESAGKRRRRALVLVDRYPTVEFVAPDETTGEKMASIIRDRHGKHIPDGPSIPPEYQGFPTALYNTIVIGAGAATGLAVVCDDDDIDTMVKHALIRYRYREERKK